MRGTDTSIILTKIIIQIILQPSMGSQSIPAEAANAYDDHSFINEYNSRREHECDSTRRSKQVQWTFEPRVAEAVWEK
jgi:hypothetical protein